MLHAINIINKFLYLLQQAAGRGPGGPGEAPLHLGALAGVPQHRPEHIWPLFIGKRSFVWSLLTDPSKFFVNIVYIRRLAGVGEPV